MRWKKTAGDYEGNAINADHVDMCLRAKDGVGVIGKNHYGGSIAMSAKRMRRSLGRRNTVAVGYRGKSNRLWLKNLLLQAEKQFSSWTPHILEEVLAWWFFVVHGDAKIFHGILLNTKPLEITWRVCANLNKRGGRFGASYVMAKGACSAHLGTYLYKCATFTKLRSWLAMSRVDQNWPPAKNWESSRCFLRKRMKPVFHSGWKIGIRDGRIF